MGNIYNRTGSSGYKDRGERKPTGERNFSVEDSLTKEVENFLEKHPYKSTWIRDGIDEDFLNFAEEIGKYMAINKLTSSKIRSIYGEVKRIQMGGYDKEKSSFLLLRPKVAYAYGREKKNKDRKGLLMFKCLFDKCSADVNDEKTFSNFCNVMEAILAYHKANVKKDD